jgi:predicted permease
MNNIYISILLLAAIGLFMIWLGRKFTIDGKEGKDTKLFAKTCAVLGNFLFLTAGAVFFISIVPAATSPKVNWTSIFQIFCVTLGGTLLFFILVRWTFGQPADQTTALFFVIAVLFLLLPISFSPPPKDTTQFKPSNFHVVTDTLTGCEYIQSSSGCLTPRLDSAGNQFCSKEKPR